MHAFSPLIRYFEEVATQGSVRRAAERLHIAPSAVTRQIMKLEEALDMQLFDRLPRGVRLTSAGELLLASVHRLQRDFDSAITQVDALKGLRRGRISIGVMQHFSDQVIPDLITELNAQYPGIVFTVFVGNSDDIVDRIAKGELDIGLCWEPPASAPVRRVRTAAMPIGLVVRPDHPYAARKSVRLRECARLPLILPTDDMELRRVLDSTLHGAAERLDPMTETNSIATLRQLTLLGTGVAIMARINIVRDIREGRLVHVPLSDKGVKSFHFALLVRSERNLSVAAAMLLELLESRFNGYVGHDAARKSALP